jgi:hypothetical protein
MIKIRISSVHQSAWIQPPPLMAQMCNGTIAGLGYMEVSVDCPWKFPACAVVHVRTGSIPDGEKIQNLLGSLTDCLTDRLTACLTA